jgi:hypothetical protein
MNVEIIEVKSIIKGNKEKKEEDGACCLESAWNRNTSNKGKYNIIIERVYVKYG